ncbi:DNA ligase D [Candidatus Parcubacteria bacterium]|nr:DNA ligase D [Candidatus Parcubacteria bacterium]
MALEKYKQKRRFNETPEPKGDRHDGTGPLRFVVQKHQASRLHYDFRLELDGVLKSWAVPKGPSLNPEDKRLAMMVEDHPYDYRTFEGIIPQGNYGGGTVMVWDEGNYHAVRDAKTGDRKPKPDRPATGPTSRQDSERLLKHGLHAGNLKFILDGHKLKGEFALIKLKNAEDNAWLLMKKDDQWADPKRDVTKQDRSAVTGRTMPEIADQSEAQGNVWRSSDSSTPDDKISPDQNLPAEALSGAPKAEMPRDVKPMLATLTDQPFDREGWLFEVKWDGYRAIAEVDQGKVKLYSRNLQPFNQKFPPVVAALRGLSHDAVLDGEVVALDEDGKPRFQLLQNWAKGVGSQADRGVLVYYAFDLIWLGGHDLTGLALIRRKQLLAQILPVSPHLKISDHITERGKDFFEAARGQDLEGVMAKDAQSTYRPGVRTKSWLKVKTHRRQKAVVGGFTEPRGSRQGLGAVVLGVYQDDKLVYIGHTGGGFTDQSLAQMKRRLKPLIRQTSPFSASFKTNAPVTWVEPRVVVEVSFAEWTGDGHMRQPILVGVREDKDPRQVRRELPQAVPVGGSEETAESKQDPSDKPDITQYSMPESKKARNRRGQKEATHSNNQELVIGRKKLRTTHLNKVFWPDEGYTKGDVIAYYRRMAPLMLPYLKDRPQSLLRHPNGINGKSFFQKDMDLGQLPRWAKTYAVRSQSEDRDIDYLVCNDAATLVYMANLGCIEINPWNSRTKRPDHPDYLVMDLDPEDIGFEQVIEVAQAVYQVCQRAGAPSYCKTSGATGLHIYVPLAARYDYEQTKEFARLIGLLVNQTLPDITSLERSPAKRQQKVYLDYLQNRRGQTMAAAYSLRPKPGATVSTPLRWDEVKPGLKPSDFTIRTITDRVNQVGDLWRPVIGKGIDLQACLERLTASGS